MAATSARFEAAALTPRSSALLTGCTPTVPLKAAPEATESACADVVVHLPEEVAGQPSRETDAQGTGAWGSPDSTVLLRCGVDVPGPTTERCIGVSGVDWVIDDSRQPLMTYTTYGRSPAVEVFVNEDPDGGISGSSVLAALADAIGGSIEATGGCTDPAELLTTEAPVAPAD
jgi:hypothetical protein